MLVAEGLTKRFGGVLALEKVTAQFFKCSVKAR